MSLPKMTTAVNNISQLDTRPNAVNGLTADELKAEFDKGPEAIKKFLNEVLIPALDGAITLDALGAVPKTRKVNGQALSADVTVSAEDVPAFGPDQLKRTTQFLLDELADGVSKAVPKTRKVAGKTLDEDIALAAEDVGYSKTVGGVTTEGTVKTELNSLNAAMDGKVPTTRTVAGKSLDANIRLDEKDIDYDGTVAGTQVQGDLGDALDMISLKLGATVPKTRKVNGKPLDADVTLDAESIDYAGAISGAANVKAALDALNARKDVAVFSATLSGETLSSAATFPEISAAYSAGKQVLLKVLASDGTYWLLPLVRLLGGMVASFAAWVSNSRLAVATLNYSAASTPPVNAWSLTQVPLSAESVAYSGKVGSGTVANVKAALDGLAIGKPLDMTADYVASGAENVAKWATMAKVVNGVASTTEYRVAPGRYAVLWDQLDTTYVTILPSADGGTSRLVIETEQQADDGFLYISVCYSVTPGADVDTKIYLSNEEHCLEIGGKTLTLPTYDQTSAADEGKILRIVKSNGENVYRPRWVTLPTYDGGVS